MLGTGELGGRVLSETCFGGVRRFKKKAKDFAKSNSNVTRVNKKRLVSGIKSGRK